MLKNNMMVNYLSLLIAKISKKELNEKNIWKFNIISFAIGIIYILLCSSFIMGIQKNVDIASWVLFFGIILFLLSKKTIGTICTIAFFILSIVSIFYISEKTIYYIIAILVIRFFWLAVFLVRYALKGATSHL